MKNRKEKIYIFIHIGIHTYIGTNTFKAFFELESKRKYILSGTFSSTRADRNYQIKVIKS